MVTPMNFKWKFEEKKIKTHKNSYTTLLCTPDSEYEDDGHKIWSFGQFLSQTGDFQ
jgi:hypothetical protein